MSIREERALHYAMARFAEMEQYEENTVLVSKQADQQKVKERRIQENELKSISGLKVINLLWIKLERFYDILLYCPVNKCLTLYNSWSLCLV